MSILVTGGCGYIGSNTCVELLNNGYDVVIIDNLSNSSETSIAYINEITGKQIGFYPYDLCNIKMLEEVFQKENIELVIHFAGLKAVGESVEKPLLYYRNNIIATLNLLEVMKASNVRKLVFSSSATVYGVPKSVPISEDFPLHTTNPYGTTKLMQERVFTDLQKADSSWNFVFLRYFNPVGSHESGLLGENPSGIPNNLMPYIARVAEGKLPILNIFGGDYSTVDGTGVRDYIHVTDLAKGHIAALNKMEEKADLYIYNLGTGCGYSVLQMVQAFAEINNIEIPYRITERRPGDIAVCYADTSKAERELGWKAEKTIRDMCKQIKYMKKCE